MSKGQAQLKRLTDTQARAYMERIRWPNGPQCPACKSLFHHTLGGKARKRGLYQCKDCKKLYTVTMGTVMESTKVNLWKWVYAFAAMTASKKGISAHQLHRELGVTYKTAWFMAHRVRYALAVAHEGKLGGPQHVVQADEAFVGGKPRHHHTYKPQDKTPVVTLVEKTGQGRVRTVVTNDVSASTLRRFLLENADTRSVLMTDEHLGYTRLGRMFKNHRTVAHSAREYGRREPDGSMTDNNTAESYFALLKRGMYGVFHHCSPEHLQRYVHEFDFRWNTRKMNDTERTAEAVAQVGDKRLYYRKPKGVIQGSVLGGASGEAPDGQQ